ncbi:kinesin-domain-containing protein [Dichomitus squalens LYAD-421 SS1]|uniref:Kinesin-domain-containing protein n=1 Tax=Dichomitus squalens (strain LYAD-421) TaxID=732165 RepID=R7SZB0_DICSQ|nr:kinesin-domain-containing protein [Dichomitus squalens LYAD-421 SS1]EJF61268.1 kinesin-domain-containing protein [Dichomitus squalens LYAD-421 SS1]
MAAAGSITVAVRVRPPTPSEAARLPQQVYDACIRGDGALSTPGRVANTSTLRDIVQIVDDRVLTFDPMEKDQTRAFVERGFLPPGTKRYKDRRFIFDRVFRHDATQAEVYGATARPLLKTLLDGYNTTIFAYGATGCGKTHTISGTDSDPGIIYLTMADLFQEIEDRKEDYIVDVMVTFLEIYNEEIRDLLAEPGNPAPRGGLQIREDKSVKVVGLTELRPMNADEVKQIVLLGNSRRTQSPTHANETSSRSHAVLQVHVTQAPRTAALTEQKTMATLSIIDLAGSERAAATTNMGQRMVEGANINKSLLALGNCINALCESGGAIRHVPYRNSKLTRLLKFSLGGNCKTVMIVCVAPTSAHFDDTHNTLIYAERATKIKTKVITRNVVNVDRHVGQYVEAINRLNLEVAELKEKLAGRRDQEREAEKRKRREALLEVERAKSDLKLKAEQMQPSIADGANCAGKLAVAEAKLKVIRARLAELDAQAADSSTPLSSDLETERVLLQALAGPEEQILRAESALNVRVQRASNSGALFDATLRAVQERRSSDKLDEVSVENVKLDARWRKADMERVKAEAQTQALREAVTAQTEALVSLVGLVGRCTVMLGEAGRALTAATGEGREGLESTAKSLSVSLKSVAEGNDAAFKSLLGHSIASYTVAPVQESASALSSFKGFASLGHGRVVSGPIVSQQSKTKVSRRSSSYGSSSPLRKSVKSPRRSLRSSLAASSAPYRRVSDKDKGKKKGVQWRDYAGQGDLDDGGEGSASGSGPVVVSVTPADAGSASFSIPAETSQRNVSIGGSESEWEDEKTDTSMEFTLFSKPSTSSAGASSSSASSSTRGALGKRPRASRLDPGFLKSRSRASALGSLVEDDESAALGSPQRNAPLMDRNMNRAPSPSDESSSSSTAVGKARERHHNSPAKRGPSTPKAASKSGHSRRRSNIGPMRVERPRRRSSLIPQLSPQARASLGGGGSSSVLGKGPRRVPLGERSPAKRPKRMSLLAVSSARIASSRLKAADPNASMDVSFRSGSAAGGSRPTWR